MQLHQFSTHFSSLFRSLGLLIAKCPWPFVLIPIAISVLLGTGLLWQNDRDTNDPIYLYTPSNAHSVLERQVIAEHWPLDENEFIPGKQIEIERLTQLIVRANDQSNLLSYSQVDYLEEIQLLNNFIMKDLRVPKNQSDLSEGSLSYKDLCLSWRGNCFENDHVSLLRRRQELERDHKILITYPRTFTGGSSVYLANVIGRVKFSETSGALRSVESVYLVYYLKQSLEASLRWEKTFAAYLDTYSHPHLDFAFLHSQSIADGLLENSLALRPRFMVTFAILFAFVVLCSFVWKVSKQGVKVDLVSSSPLLALSGLACAGMGIASGQGLMLLAGMDYNAIVAIMPFLVISIGVDDMFIMVAAWRTTKAKSSLEDRICEAVQHSAVSITVTSLTNALSFGIGMITSIRAVRLFCAYTAAAIVFNYVYQVTFFIAMMVINGRLEEKFRKRLEAKPAIPTVTETVDTVAVPPPTVAAVDTVVNCTGRSFFKDVYGPLLMKKSTKTAVISLLGVYLIVGVWGCTYLQEGLKPQNLMLRTFHGYKFYDFLEKYVWPQGVQVDVVVNSPPDMQFPSERQKLVELVNNIEGLQCIMASNATQFWLRGYEQFLADKGLRDLNDAELWSSSLKQFTQLNSFYKLWSQDLAWASNDANSTELKAFRFWVGLRNFETPNAQRQCLLDLRKVASDYAELNVTTYMQDWPYLDQYLIILPNTLQNIAVGLGCMILCSVVFIPNVICALWISFTIISIDIGVVGFMTWWNVNLDAVSMITIIMSIGFSVDYSAHITYGYMVAKGNRNSRACEALESLGWPVLEGAISTLLGVLALATVDAYMIVTFFKTVFLVIIFGLLHACVFLPVLLTIFGSQANCPSPMRLFSRHKYTVNP